MDLTRADEGRHPPGGPAWEESWAFEWATADARLGGYARLALRPATGLASWWSAVAGPGRRPALVADDAVRLPSGRSLEVRADALWADHVCETAGDHWTVGAEAFAVALDDPVEAWGAAWGDRVPFGLDLEWEADGAARPLAGAGAGYEVPCLVTGEVIVGDEHVDVEAWGWRRHTWGEPPAAEGRSWAGGRLAGGAWVSGPLDGPPWPGDALPAGGRVGGGAAGVGVEPVAFAPVLAEPPGRPAVRVALALCRLRSAAGATGAGWAGWAATAT